jgi:hypothetical protein
MVTMRVYHFLRAKYGIENIRKRHLKISLLQDLNDPFELLSIELSDKELRRRLIALKQNLSGDRGLHCFSRNWTNPVQWGHYAERHRGLCLGFEIPKQCLIRVEYAGKRLVKEAEQTKDRETMRKLLCTKYSHWRYEGEERAFVDLTGKGPDAKGRYFADFSTDLRLRRVVVGARSEISRADLAKALGPLVPEVEAFKARLAFQSFRVVRNRQESLWA